MTEVKHKCFISYHHDDQDEVKDFIERFDEDGEAFIARAVGAMGQDIIDSEDTDYVMRRIREKYLTDSTVTIVLIGKCTWARRYVDWEIASTLRNDPNNKRSGLFAITLPGVADKIKTLPARFQDNLYNWDKKKGYAKWYKYPDNSASLTNMIEDAFQARDDDERTKHIDNSRALFGYNRECK
jgi:hypothetical protein